MAKEKIDIEEAFRQFAEHTSGKDGMSQLLQQNTVAGQVPFANFLMPMLMKQMGLPEFPTLPTDLGMQLHRNRGTVAAKNIWAANPAFQGVQQNVRREMLTRYLAKGAETGTAAYAKAREQALATIGSAPKIDMLGGLLGLDIGAERALDAMTSGVGDFETAAASITNSTARRYGAASFKDVRDRSQQIIESLKDDILDPDDKGLPEGERRLRKDFRKRLGGMNVDEFAGTYEVMLREGALSRDGKKATEEVKSMGGVIQAGKDLFGSDASPEAILSAAREIVGTIKPGDEKLIKQAFESLSTMLEVSGQGIQEHMQEVQKLRTFAAARGSSISSKEASSMVTDREMYTNALVSGGMDRSTATGIAYKRYETGAEIRTSNGREMAIAALTAAGGDTALADKLIAGGGTDEERFRFGQVRSIFANDPTGKAFERNAEMFSKSDDQTKWLHGKAQRDLAERLAPRLNTGVLAEFKFRDVGHAMEVYDKVIATAGDPAKQKKLAEELGVSTGTILTATTEFVDGSTGKLMTALNISARGSAGIDTFTAEDETKKKNTEKLRLAKAQAEERAKVFDAEDAASAHAWVTTGKGATGKFAELMFGDSLETDPKEKQERDARLRRIAKQMMYLSKLDDEKKAELGIDVDEHMKALEGAAAGEGMMLTREIATEMAKSQDIDSLAINSGFKPGKESAQSNKDVAANILKERLSKSTGSTIDTPGSSAILPIPGIDAGVTAPVEAGAGKVSTDKQSSSGYTFLPGREGTISGRFVSNEELSKKSGATSLLDTLGAGDGVRTSSINTSAVEDLKQGADKFTAVAKVVADGLDEMTDAAASLKSVLSTFSAAPSASFVDKNGNTVNLTERSASEIAAANEAQLNKIKDDEKDRDAKAADSKLVEEDFNQSENTEEQKQKDLADIDARSTALSKLTDDDAMAQMDKEQAEAAARNEAETTAAAVIPKKKEYNTDEFLKELKAEDEAKKSKYNTDEFLKTLDSEPPAAPKKEYQFKNSATLDVYKEQERIEAEREKNNSKSGPVQKGTNSVQEILLKLEAEGLGMLAKGIRVLNNDGK